MQHTVKEFLIYFPEVPLVLLTWIVVAFVYYFSKNRKPRINGLVLASVWYRRSTGKVFDPRKPECRELIALFTDVLAEVEK